ncbi:hypothetical protein FB567DRAFT_319314 [Paraphoma chrysanthemicola]|uniref:Clr5 domain-containing protein n=1 Tax=Paraphoma chrysanthemicola TaxID=798071 RepID=A0A8K0VZV6_9PLEO|nr:hypothetical protein FB567DRAFT_319314 [Paraphoma chrysanthemicola]
MSAAGDWQMEIEPYQYHQAFVPVQVPPSGEQRLESIEPSSETTKGRKTKAPTLRDSDWEPHKDRIHDLHIIQGKPLKEVKQIMHKQYDFSAEYVADFIKGRELRIGIALTMHRIRQYRSRITKWKLDKNIKPAEMKCIVKKRQQRKLLEPNKPDLMFRVRGNPVEPAKVQRWMNRHDVPDSMLYAASPVASTPSAISCYTMSAVASPASSSSSSVSTSALGYHGQEWKDDLGHSSIWRIPPVYSLDDLLGNVLLTSSSISNSQELPVFVTNPSAPTISPRVDFDHKDALRAFQDFVWAPDHAGKHQFVYRKLDLDRQTLFVAISHTRTLFGDKYLLFNVSGQDLEPPSTLIGLLTLIFHPRYRGQRAQYCLVPAGELVTSSDMPFGF